MSNINTKGSSTSGTQPPPQRSAPVNLRPSRVGYPLGGTRDGQGGQQSGGGSISPDSTGLGSNREEIFNRIMRKLQHQANYSSDANLTITQQALGGSAPNASPLVAPVIQKAAAKPENEPGGKVHLQAGVRLASQRVRSEDEGATASPVFSAPPPLPASGGKTTGAKDMEDEEERRFGMQPCPPTLRLVLEHVRSVVDEKLSLAFVGSLGETMRFLFESRTILDKLLKEVPQHAHFQEVSLTNASGASATSAAIASKVQELFQEFRKIPVVLPTTGYQQDAVTGRFSAEVLKVVPSQAEMHLPHQTPAPPSNQPNSNPTPNRASRRSTVNSSSGKPSDGGLFHQYGLPRVGDAAPPPPPAAGHQLFIASAGIKDKKDHEMLMRYLRRKTQLEDRGMQTDENSSTIILKEMYVALGKKCADLEMEVEGKKGALRELTAKMEKNQKILESKSSIIQYLRTTLFKELCLMRQQLAAAQQKQVIMQQQQQILSQQVMGQVSSIGLGGSHTQQSQSSAFATSQSMALESSRQFNATSGTGSGMSTFSTPTAVEDTDITAIHSVIDLAMLGVEKNRALNKSTDELRQISAFVGNTPLLSTTPAQDSNDQLLTMNVDAQLSRAKEDIQHQSMKWKRELASMRAKFAIVVKEKNKQIRSIQMASDVQNLRSILLSQMGAIRQDYGILRKQVRESISSMRNFLLSGLAEVEYSVKLIADAIEQSAQRERTAIAQSELIASCRDLFIPMMTYDYSIGSHMWLQKYRVGDPLLHVLQTKFGNEIIGHIAPELESMHLVYQTLQKFVLKTVYGQPMIAHPQVGVVLVRLLHSLLSDFHCTPDLQGPLRQCLQVEYDLTRKLARINFNIKVTTWKQQTAQECATKAMREAGLDIHAAGPTQKVINRLGMKATTLLAMKADVVRQRMSNAKEVHRIWRESALDPFRGKRAPPTRELVITALSAVLPTGGGAKRGGQSKAPKPLTNLPSPSRGAGESDKPEPMVAG